MPPGIGYLGRFDTRPQLGPDENGQLPRIGNVMQAVQQKLQRYAAERQSGAAPQPQTAASPSPSPLSRFQRAPGRLQSPAQAQGGQQQDRFAKDFSKDFGGK